MKPLIIFTGGHHNSALEVAKEARKNGYELLWIGHKFTQRGDKSLSAEFQEVTANKIRFLELKTGKFYKKIDILEWIKIVLGFIQSFYYLLLNRPSLIFSSGGYLSVPVVIVGWCLRIPSITHEQTVVAGWANKAIAPFVKKILLTHESSLSNYPQSKTAVVGLPIRPELLQAKYSKKYKPPLLYITCGKQGSHIINQALFPIIPDLVKDFTVVHQTGASTLTKDIDRARRIKDRLGDLKSRYSYAPYYFSEDAVTYLRSAQIIISRSGAHSAYELMLLNKKSILIPIPWVSHNEQLLNAQLVSEQTGSLILEETDLNPETLLEAIRTVNKKAKTKPSIKLATNATQKILKVISEYA